jgi:hypothetical protein
VESMLSYASDDVVEATWLRRDVDVESYWRYVDGETCW